MKKLLNFGFFLILALCLCSSQEIFAQCAMCKAVVKAGSEDSASSVGTTLNMAILYLMGIPYVLAGVGGYVWWKKSQKDKKEDVSLN